MERKYYGVLEGNKIKGLKENSMTEDKICFDHKDYWFKLEDKYNIKFITEDGSFRPVDEWLDDLYLQCPSSFKEMMEEIFLNGDILFADLKEHKQ